MSQTVALTQNVLRQQLVLALVCACGAMLALLEDEYCQPYCTDRLAQRYPQFVLHLRTCMALEWRSLARSRCYSHTAQEGLSLNTGDGVAFIWCHRHFCQPGNDTRTDPWMSVKTYSLARAYADEKTCNTYLRILHDTCRRVTVRVCLEKVWVHPTDTHGWAALKHWSRCSFWGDVA